MPLIIEGDRVPKQWLNRQNPGADTAIRGQARLADSISIALINNMPDAALEDTEFQFFNLLDTASGNKKVYLKLYSLTGVPRTERGERHLNSFYLPLDDLWSDHLDGVIVTGTEPHSAELQNEPYWNSLVRVFDWASRSTNSAILSCLAAHASVLHYDGIRRHPLREKKFGVFEAAMTSDHLLMTGLPRTIQFPHSRWNEIRQDELSPSGYFVLAKSEDAGVDSFVKKRDKSLFVHFQGHPEYGAETLLKEYRRDIKRFLRGERDNYPPMPRGYFDGTAFQVLERFRGVALSNRCEGVIDSFPESVLSGLNHPWQSSAIAVYRNWLGYLSSRKIEASTFVGFGRSRGSSHQAHNDVA